MLSMCMLWLKIQFGNVSRVYEVVVPSFVVTSKVDLEIAEGKGGIILDWSDYDILDKYFVIYRKQNGEEEWKKLINLEEKFNGSYFIDNLGNDKGFSSVTEINVKGDEDRNNLKVDVSAIDSGTEHLYYIEAYDKNSVVLSKSNLIFE